MKHIAMLTCLNANAVCTGASCLKAFYDRTGSFAIYQTEALYLDAFMKCNGCGNPPNTDHGMLEKGPHCDVNERVIQLYRSFLFLYTNHFGHTRT